MPIDPEIEIEGLLSEDRTSSPGPRRQLCRQDSHHYQRGRLISSISILTLTLATFLLGLIIGLLSSPSLHLNNRISFTLSREILLPEDIPATWHETTFNGSLFHETIYRGSPSQEVDDAWEGLGINYNSILVPPHAAARAGFSTDQVRVREKYGGGYVANVEGLHHLHCLNLLRQTLHWNFEYYHTRGQGAFENDGVVVRKHVTHCLDILRQQLMCTIDVGVMGQVWIQPSPDRLPEAFVDFNTKHTCRDFEEVRRWAYEHQIQEPTPHDLLQPPREGSKILTQIP